MEHEYSEFSPIARSKTYTGIAQARSIICPVCGHKTKTRMYHGTKLKDFPLWCPWCKKEYIISTK